MCVCEREVYILTVNLLVKQGGIKFLRCLLQMSRIISLSLCSSSCDVTTNPHKVPNPILISIAKHHFCSLTFTYAPEEMREEKKDMSMLFQFYCIAGNFRGRKLLRIRPKIIFTELIFANFIIQPFYTVLFIISQILFSQISKNCKKSESYWPRKFLAIW